MMWQRGSLKRVLHKQSIPLRAPDILSKINEAAMPNPNGFYGLHRA